MIQVLLVTICLAAFPYQGSSIILESGNVNDYEVVYPRKVTALPKGAVQPKYEDAMQYEFKVNREPVVLHLEKNKDVKCGRLFCDNKKYPCHYDYSEDPDYGMVDHGTKCADGKVCNSNRQCVDVTTAY